MVALATRGRNANSAVLDALVEKFGRPTSSKPNLNEARWQIGQQVLSFDGYAGKVFLADLEANRRRKGNAAQSNKKDL